MVVPHSVTVDDYCAPVRFDFPSLDAALHFLHVDATQRGVAEQTLTRCQAWIADTGTLDGQPFVTTVYPTSRLE